MENDVLAMLTKNSSHYSKGQKLITDFILNNYDKAAFMTAGKLGEVVGVSESTVVRFATELGYSGYPAMRRAMQEMIRSRLTTVQRIEVAKKLIDSRDVAKSVVTNDMRNLQTTLDDLDRAVFDSVIDAIIEAKSIYIVGMRTSTSLSSFLGLYLNLLRGNVNVVHDTAASEIFEQLLRIGEGDLFIGMSFPRYSIHTVGAMEFAKKRGAKTVAITDSPASPLTEIANLCLYAKSNMVSFLDSLVAPMTLINAIIIAVGLRNQETLAETFTMLENVWSEHDVYESSDS